MRLEDIPQERKEKIFKEYINWAIELYKADDPFLYTNRYTGEPLGHCKKLWIPQLGHFIRKKREWEKERAEKLKKRYGDKKDNTDV